MSKKEDNRFSTQAPIFKALKQDKLKVRVDDRFVKPLLQKDTRFSSLPGKIDQYGRKRRNGIDKTNMVEEMKEFYTVDVEDKIANGDDEKEPQSRTTASSSSSSDTRLEYLTRLARGEISGNDSTSSSSDSDEEEEDEEEEDDVDEDKQALDKNTGSSSYSALAIPGTEHATEKDQDDPEKAAAVAVESTRIAIANCDWEHLTAEDLMMVLQSFCPVGGAVHRVTVYVSDFGEKRMERESRYGPQGIWKTGKKDAKDDSDDDDDDEDDDDRLYTAYANAAAIAAKNTTTSIAGSE